MKAVAGVAGMFGALWMLHHAVDHGSFWEGFAACCVGAICAFVALDFDTIRIP